MANDSERLARVVTIERYRGRTPPLPRVTSTACQQYHATVLRNGRSSSAASDSAFALGGDGRPWMSPQPFRTPRSPTGQTSCLASGPIRNISAVHRPTPLTSLKIATTRSSSCRPSALRSSEPSDTRPARSSNARRFASETPHERKAPSGAERMPSGVKEPPRSATTRPVMVVAAAPASC